MAFGFFALAMGVAKLHGGILSLDAIVQQFKSCQTISEEPAVPQLPGRAFQGG